MASVLCLPWRAVLIPGNHLYRLPSISNGHDAAKGLQKSSHRHVTRRATALAYNVTASAQTTCDPWVITLPATDAQDDPKKKGTLPLAYLGP